MHIADGSTVAGSWMNFSGTPKGIRSSGQGGEGEYRGGSTSITGQQNSNMQGEGGGGGGGYGGGGGGGGGGGTYQGAGGGGGGSYAAASTVATDLSFTDPGDSKNGVVIVGFPP